MKFLVIECYTAGELDKWIPYPHALFFAMEPLHLLFKKAQANLLIQKLHPCCDTFRVSMYADDVSLFLSPIEKEMKVMECIMKLLADASGLNTNMSKTQFFPIHYQETDLSFLLATGQPISTFPCSYLGLPLHTSRLTKATMQPIIQKIGGRLLGWKRRFMTYSGREILVKIVLLAMPTHFITSFKPSKWLISGIDKYRRSFL
jgi:hypothetical protein